MMSSVNKVPEISDIGILDIVKLDFYKSQNGFLRVKYNDVEYKRIILSRTMPYTDPESYICVADSDMKEIGILKSIEDLSEEQAGLVREELEKRYFNPIIKKIESAKMKMGYVYFDVLLSNGKKVFAVKDFSRNIRKLDKDRLVITDVDGNRYLIESLEVLDAKSKKKLEPYLF